MSEGPAVERDRNRGLDSLIPACLSTPDLNSNEAGKPAETLLVTGNRGRSGDLIEFGLFKIGVCVLLLTVPSSLKLVCRQRCLMVLPSFCSCRIVPSPPPFLPPYGISI